MVAAVNVHDTQSRVRSLLGDESGDLRASQLRLRTLISFPAQEGQLSQADARVLLAGSGGFTLQLSQAFVRTLIKYGAERRELRAWTITQDDHDWYGINLGEVSTLIFDKLTRQWSVWRSPGFDYFRVVDATSWEGFNLGCDTESGILWEFDPEGRLDNETTPITSIVTGGFTTRMRNHTPIYMAELAISEGSPPFGHGDGSVGISLRTSDDGGLSFYSHGAVDGGAIGDEVTVRWYGLGLAKSPGRVFEITDTGYARRIDALDIEMPDGQ